MSTRTARARLYDACADIDTYRDDEFLTAVRNVYDAAAAVLELPAERSVRAVVDAGNAVLGLLAEQPKNQ